uniref:DNA polymerase kappa isoform X2 n=1 Tax=Tanacetum cinerariifolium TaxID=118510 RepID=A0A699H7W7_TANCI|nr:DNA polymerase kappa isoform X2 [Tanacetum cinerariifolium]
MLQRPTVAKLNVWLSLKLCCYGGKWCVWTASAPKLKLASFECIYTDILKHASRLIKAELPLSLRLIGVRMPHFSKDKSGVQFDPRQRTLLNFIKAKDNKKQIVNEEHSAYFKDGYEAHGCSHIDPSSDHLSELQQNICMPTDNIKEAVEHHRSDLCIYQRVQKMKDCSSYLVKALRNVETKES